MGDSLIVDPTGRLLSPMPTVCSFRTNRRPTRARRCGTPRPFLAHRALRVENLGPPRRHARKPRPRLAGRSRPRPSPPFLTPARRRLRAGGTTVHRRYRLMAFRPTYYGNVSGRVRRRHWRPRKMIAQRNPYGRADASQKRVWLWSNVSRPPANRTDHGSTNEEADRRLLNPAETRQRRSCTGGCLLGASRRSLPEPVSASLACASGSAVVA